MKVKTIVFAKPSGFEPRHLSQILSQFCAITTWPLKHQSLGQFDYSIHERVQLDVKLISNMLLPDESILLR